MLIFVTGQAYMLSARAFAEVLGLMLPHVLVYPTAAMLITGAHIVTVFTAHVAPGVPPKES